MLNHKKAARLPDSIQFTRNGLPVEARRTQLGEVRVAGHSLRIADMMYEEGSDGQPCLPVRVPDGSFPVHAYQWDHPRGIINVCVVVAFGPQRWATTRPLVVQNEWRPDITHGVIVDTAELTLWSVTAVTFAAGLGDGVYPVVGVYNYGLFAQAIVVDLLLWRNDSHRVILLPGQVIDEYGIVRKVGPDGQT
ncbi:MAG TPA: hypothetical protein VKE74_08605 [Gemmataceae bacterium]|nr:hypothetical protein [Gemmataceae bacterium]